jgi:hypothetical protein
MAPEPSALPRRAVLLKIFQIPDFHEAIATISQKFLLVAPFRFNGKNCSGMSARLPRAQLEEAQIPHHKVTVTVP